MAAQTLATKRVICENAIYSKDASKVKAMAMYMKANQQFSNERAIPPQLTFFQRHLYQPPNGYTFLNDNPPRSSLHKLQAHTNSGNHSNLNDQLPNIQQKLHKNGLCGEKIVVVEKGETNEWERCSTKETYSNESVMNLNLNNARESVASPPKEEMPPVLGDTKEPLTYIKFFEEGTFMPQGDNTTRARETKPTVVERGYLLWEIQSAGAKVLNLETVISRTIEELNPKLEKERN